jgi:NADH dehydrogenase FAD-containing subunit
MEVAIVGGGFCGATVARRLNRRNECSVTLIDPKGTFDFTPGIVRLLHEPRRRLDYLLPFSRFLPGVRLLRERATAVTPNRIETAHRGISFDYVVIATGSGYPVPFAGQHCLFPFSSPREALALHAHVQKARTVVVVGGGPVGTEVTAELVATTDAHVTLVHPGDWPLERMPLRASRLAERFLERAGATLATGQRVTAVSPDTLVTDAGAPISCDVGIWCGGPRFDTTFLRNFPAAVADGSGRLRVNEHLQVAGFPNVFAGGDVARIAEEKTAQNAERHGELIARNLLRHSRGKKLLSYVPGRRVMILSLGPKNGIVILPPVVVGGRCAGIAKDAVARWFVHKMAHG